MGLTSLFLLAKYVWCNTDIKYLVTYSSSVEDLFSCQFCVVTFLFSV